MCVYTSSGVCGWACEINKERSYLYAAAENLRFRNVVTQYAFLYNISISAVVASRGRKTPRAYTFPQTTSLHIRVSIAKSRGIKISSKCVFFEWQPPKTRLKKLFSTKTFYSSTLDYT